MATPDRWAADACTCGHRRDEHTLKPREPWPVTGRTSGRCTSCECRSFDVDEAALAAAESAIREARVSGVAEILANPTYGRPKS
jgi:hypothetical protein